MALRCFLLIIVLFSSCSNNDQEKIRNIERMLESFSTSENEYKIKIIKKNEIKDIPYPLIEIRTNGILLQAVMLPLSERNGFSNYTSGSGQNITMYGATISKTYGLNVGMISHKIINANHFAVLTPVEEWSKESIHEFRFLTPSFKSKNFIFNCIIRPIMEEKINILDVDFLTTKFEEKCVSKKYKFTNIYWVSSEGFVWKSKQWIGFDMSNKEQIYADLYILKTN